MGSECMQCVLSSYDEFIEYMRDRIKNIPEGKYILLTSSEIRAYRYDDTEPVNVEERRKIIKMYEAKRTIWQLQELTGIIL